MKYKFTKEDIEARERVQYYREAIEALENDIANIQDRIVDSHTHNIQNIHDSACCVICDMDFGWYCNESPDSVCHYFTEKHTDGHYVRLTNGNLHKFAGLDYDGDWETYDSCLFCNDPEERK